MIAGRFDIPTTLPSRANLREHWAERHSRERKLRQDAAILARSLLSTRLKEAARAGGARIVLTRLSPRRLDRDNLAAAVKPIQDGIADALGMSDGSRLLEWDYDQEQDYPDRVRVVIECSDERGTA